MTQLRGGGVAVASSGFDRFLGEELEGPADEVGGGVASPALGPLGEVGVSKSADPS